MSDPAGGFDTALKRTSLFDVHVAAGAKMVPFAGYEMPVQYPMGVLKEHLWTRDSAGLFDVSHMGQLIITADDASFETAARGLETLVPADVLGLKPGQQRYTQFLGEDGGTLDDLMVSRPVALGGAERLALVVNASRKDADFAHLQARLPAGVRVAWQDGISGLLALQGPKAAAVMADLGADVDGLGFMATRGVRLAGCTVQVSRSGYTGEDGFEIAVGDRDVVGVWTALAAHADVRPIGLGARDSLRLEAGLCLYGHELDESVSPVEAGLVWSIGKRRRGEGGFLGAGRIQRELAQGPSRVRVGLKPEGRAPAREGTEILAATGTPVGVVTSGGFGPSVNGPIAIGYVAAAQAQPGTPVQLVVRGKALPASVVSLPFVAHRYKR